jgi:signal transduction histidine kinase
MTRRVALAAAVVALAAAIAVRFTDAHDPVSTLRGNFDGHSTGLVWDLVYSALWLGAGLYAWRRRQENRVGMLMTLVGFAYLAPWVLIGFGRLGFGIAALLDELVFAIGAHLFLAFPTGRLTSRLERTVVAVMYVDAIVIQAAALFARDFRTANCRFCPPNPFMIRSDTELANVLVNATRGVAIAVAFAIVLILARRWWKASPPARRVAAPVLWSSVLVTAVFAAGFFRSPYGYDYWPIMDWLGYAVVLVPLAFLVGVFRMRLKRSAVGDLVVQLGRPHSPADLRDMLANALGDPSVELAFWLPDAAHYVDSDGRTVPAPERSGTRGVSLVEHDGVPLAALSYDASLLEDPTLVDHVTAVARLALENSRLQAEVGARLLEVRESRARIVAATDAERRRIERNLHDGAQQTLLGLRLALRLARDHSGADRASLEAQLDEIDAELQSAVLELRTFARGVHPPILTEEGLEPALTGLARRAAIPTSVSCDFQARLPQPVETAVYYVAAEALANTIKHAQASRVQINVSHHDGQAVIEIQDDGHGGADPLGTGLRGLRDRVEALDGRLAIDSTPAAGTRVRAQIPCSCAETS